MISLIHGAHFQTWRTFIVLHSFLHMKRNSCGIKEKGERASFFLRNTHTQSLHVADVKVRLLVWQNDRNADVGKEHGDGVSEAVQQANWLFKTCLASVSDPEYESHETVTQFLHLFFPDVIF